MPNDLFTIGQKWTSLYEPELGVGQVITRDAFRVTLIFPLSGEQRTYNIKTEPPLKRFSLKKGEKAFSIKGLSFFIESVDVENNLFVYRHKDKSIIESELNFRVKTEEKNVFENFRNKKISGDFEFVLRQKAHTLDSLLKSSKVRGLLGARVNLLPHQLYLCYKSAKNAALPRVMLSDEVGLGKTIEAGLIWNCLKTEGKINRTLIIVPEALINQWIIEIGKKFNYWFTIIDENYIKNFKLSSASEENPFSLHDSVIVSMDFLLDNIYASKAILEVKWDLTIIDEAHRLVKTSKGASPEFEIAEALAALSPGILLLSGTPIQLAPEAYFYRLKLLDSARFNSYEEFEKNQNNYRKVAEDLSKISLDSDSEISWEELQKIIPKKSPIHSWMPIKADMSLTAEEWIRRVIDALGTGSSVFRNTRKGVKGFPKRILKTYPLEESKTYRKHVDALIKESEDPISTRINGAFAERDSSWKQDERVKWLLHFLSEHKRDKILMLCSDSFIVSSLSELLKEKLGENAIVSFQEEFSSLERDQAAAAFTAQDGPNLLLSSEIGSEGRNFQCAKHLLLFDLPTDSALLEQRIGRLDRIGQCDEIYIHVPFVKKSALEILFIWYNEALEIFKHSLMGGGEMYVRYENELMSFLENPSEHFDKFRKEFLPKGKAEMQKINEKAEKGRDRLLEFNSQNKQISDELLNEAKKMDSNEDILSFAFDMFDCLDIEVEQGIYPDSFVLRGLAENSEHAVILGAKGEEGISDEGEEAESMGCSVTVITDRTSALNYENLPFFHWEHPIMRNLLDKAIGDGFGATACVVWNQVPKGEYFLQYNFVLDFAINSFWGINHLTSNYFLRVLLDSKGNSHNDLFEVLDKEDILRNFKISSLPTRVVDFFAESGFEKAKKILDLEIKSICEKAEIAAIKVLESDLHRLEESYALLRDYELHKTAEQKKGYIVACKKSLSKPRLKLDSIRLLMNV